MLSPIEINFKLDKTIKRALTTELMIKSHDINVVEFHISFDGLELTADHAVKVLSVFNDTQSQTNVTCDIADGKAIYRPDTSIISQYEQVLNYVYVYHGDQSLDVRLFTYSVDSSEIDKTAIKVKTVYDQSYAELLTEFEARLQDYKDSLPQASDLRAEVDVILNKFKTDSQAKLSQYDADAQQVIADNQTAFNLAESNRQSTYEQAEDNRNQASEQAIVDWNLTADALLEIVEGNESARVDAEATRKSNETDRVSSETTRKTNETTRISNENARKSAEVIRLANEVDRVNAENVRSEFYEGFDGRLDGLESERIVLKNELINGGFVSTVSPWYSALSTSVWSADFVEVTPTSQYGGILQSRTTNEYGGKVLYIHGMVNAKVPSVNIISNSNPGTASVFHSGSGNWEKMSFIQKQSTEVARLRIEVRDDAISPIEKFQIKYVAAIDLTAIFGVGNEPTKSEMDELIKITGYLEEIRPTQKQLLAWQLKLMRQNRNALIALGGTII